MPEEGATTSGPRMTNGSKSALEVVHPTKPISEYPIQVVLLPKPISVSRTRHNHQRMRMSVVSDESDGEAAAEIVKILQQNGFASASTYRIPFF